MSDTKYTTSHEWVRLEGDVATVQGVTDYVKVGDVYDNLWVITFAPDGRARHFTEWYVQRAKPGSED